MRWCGVGVGVGAGVSVGTGELEADGEGDGLGAVPAPAGVAGDVAISSARPSAAAPAAVRIAITGVS
jgi:hypothetical protein